MAEDLARRIRDYACGRGGPLFADAQPMVSSAWLAREFGVDPRTIAAALRPHGVRPGEVEPGVRGYVIAELAGLVLASEMEQMQAGMGDPDPADWVDPPSAVDRLSEALGHPAGPVLRAAGLL